MPKLVVMITPLLDEARSVAEGWQQAGAPGTTFIESYGLRQMKTASQSAEVLPGMISMIEILRDQSETSVTLLCLVRDAAMVDKLMDVVKRVIGDLNGPGNGILFVIDVERTVGLRPYMG
jgi:nitrogen regulatory protein PII